MNIHEEDNVIFWREAGSLLHCFSHNHRFYIDYIKSQR